MKQAQEPLKPAADSEVEACSYGGIIWPKTVPEPPKDAWLQQMIAEQQDAYAAAQASAQPNAETQATAAAPDDDAAKVAIRGAVEGSGQTPTGAAGNDSAANETEQPSDAATRPEQTRRRHKQAQSRSKQAKSGGNVSLTVDVKVETALLTVAINNALRTKPGQTVTELADETWAPRDQVRDLVEQLVRDGPIMHRIVYARALDVVKGQCPGWEQPADQKDDNRPGSTPPASEKQSRPQPQASAPKADGKPSAQGGKEKASGAASEKPKLQPDKANDARKKKPRPATEPGPPVLDDEATDDEPEAPPENSKAPKGKYAEPKKPPPPKLRKSAGSHDKKSPSDEEE